MIKMKTYYDIRLTAREIGQIEGALDFLIEASYVSEELKKIFRELLDRIGQQFAEQQLRMLREAIEGNIIEEVTEEVTEGSEDAPFN